MTASYISFKESLLGPWGTARTRSRAGGGTGSLLDAIPRAQKKPTEAIGRISCVNSYISEVGLHRRNTLPPVIFDLYSPPREEKDAMSHRRGKPVKRKKPQQQDRKLPVSKQTKQALEEIDHASIAADTQLIELANYPGFDAHAPTPLPHGLSPLEQMRRVTSAQIKLSTKLECYRRIWCELFYSSASQAIFLDYFWWFFLHKYQKNQLAIQDLLFSRIATNYVKIILCEPIDIRTKDSFFKMYPDVIAQCVYSTLVYAYPNSWVSFDESFKLELCQYITLWQVGTKPLPNDWEKWELSLLEPTDLPKLKTKDGSPAMKGGNPGVKATAGSFDFDVLLKNAREKSAASTQDHSKFESSHERKLTIGEVKKVLHNSRCGGGGVIPPIGETKKWKDSVAFARLTSPEERRIGVAMEQLTSLEKASLHPKSHPSTAQSHNKTEVDSLTSTDVQSMAKLGKLKDVPAKAGKSEREASVPASKSTHNLSRRWHTNDTAAASAHPTKPSTSAGQHRPMSSAKSSRGGGGELKKIALAFRERPRKHESATIRGPEFEHVVFNLYGHSPLVKHYMDNLKLSHVNEKEIVVGRTEIAEEPPRDALCYRDILKQSKMATESNRELFLRHYKQQRRAMVSADRKRLEAKQMHDQNVKLMLAKTKEAHQLTEEMMHQSRIENKSGGTHKSPRSPRPGVRVNSPKLNL